MFKGELIGVFRCVSRMCIPVCMCVCVCVCLKVDR